MNKGTNGSTVYTDIRQAQHPVGSQRLLNTARRRRRVFHNGVIFESVHDGRDCNIIFRTSAEDIDRAGQIEKIFTYAVLKSNGSLEDTPLVYVKPLIELSDSDLLHDPYVRYGAVGGQLFYNHYSRPIIIEVHQIIAHCARTPVMMPKIAAACVHVLSLDKVRDSSIARQNEIS